MVSCLFDGKSISRGKSSFVAVLLNCVCSLSQILGQLVYEKNMSHLQFQANAIVARSAMKTSLSWEQWEKMKSGTNALVVTQSLSRTGGMLCYTSLWKLVMAV